MLDAASLEAGRMVYRHVTTPWVAGEQAAARQRFEELLRAGERIWDAKGRFLWTTPHGPRVCSLSFVSSFVCRIYQDRPDSPPGRAGDLLVLFEHLKSLGMPTDSLISYRLCVVKEGIEMWAEQAAGMPPGLGELLELARPEAREEWQRSLARWGAGGWSPALCAELRATLAQIEAWTELRRAWVAAVVGRRAR